MNKEYFFRNAEWIGSQDRTKDSFSVIRGYFDLESIKKVTLNILGLGFFKCYINGFCVNPDTFLPLSSDFEAGCDPVDEVISGHRVYVPQFDITEFVKCGKNSIAIHYGGGWYTHRERTFGLPKAIYCITAESESGIRHFVSDENCRVGKSFVEKYNFTWEEHHDLSGFESCFKEDFDDSEWENAVCTESLETEYCKTDCPWDKVIYTLPAKIVNETENGIVYDCGENTTGYPVLKLLAEKGEKETFRYLKEDVLGGKPFPWEE